MMGFKNVVHKGLRRLIEHDDPSGLPPAVVQKLQRMLSFLQEMTLEEELHSIPIWKAHLLSGNRKGTWSLFVTKNWRLTFRIDPLDQSILDLDFQDYH